MPTDVARYFSASCRMSDMDGISEIELLGQLRKIIRIRVHVIAVPRLHGAAMPSPVVRYNAIAVLTEEQHLGVPVIGTERPAVAEDYRLSLSPVSFLPWARQPYACTIFNLHTVHSPEGLKRSECAFRRLIDMAARRGGTYYLTYHRYATRNQVESCYLQFAEFLRLKKKYDSEERFQGDWYRHY